MTSSPCPNITTPHHSEPELALVKVDYIMRSQFFTRAVQGAIILPATLAMYMFYLRSGMGLMTKSLSRHDNSPTRNLFIVSVQNPIGDDGMIV